MEPPFFPLPQDPNYVVPEPTDELQCVIEASDEEVVPTDFTKLWKEIAQPDA